MPKFINTKTGQVVEFDTPEAAFKAGFTEPYQDEGRIVEYSTGERQLLDPEAADVVESSGFAHDLKDEADAEATRRRLDLARSEVTAGDQVGSTVLSALNTLSMGAIPGDIRSSGDSLDDAVFTEETSTARGIGTGVGIAASLLTPSGAASLAGAAKAGAAAGKASKAASGVKALMAEGVAATPLGALTRAGEHVAANVAAKTGSKALGMGTGAAIEGGVYGAVSTATEILHSDQEFSAEAIASKIFENGAKGALLGGAFGGGAGLIASKAAKLKARDVKKANEALDFTTEAGKAVKRSAASYGRRADDIVASARSRAVSDDLVKKADNIAARIERRVGAKLADEEFVAKLTLMKPQKAAQVISDIDEHVKVMKQLEASVPEGAVVLDRLELGQAGATGMGLPGIQAPKGSSYDSIADILKPDDMAELLGKKATRADGVSPGVIDSAATFEMLGVTDVLPDSGVAGFLANAYAVHALTRKAPKVNQSAKALSAPGKLKRFVTQPVVALGGMVGSVKNRVSNGARSFAKGGSKVAPKGGQFATLTTAEVLKNASLDFSDNPEPTAKGGDLNARAVRLMRQVHQAAANPEMTKRNVVRRLADVQAYDARLADDVADKVVSKLAYLSSVAPKLRGPNPFTKRDMDKFSTTEIMRFGDITKAVLVPESLISDINSGTLTVAKVNAVKATSPRVFAEIQGQIMEQVINNPDALPYWKRVQLSYMFDVTADPSMDPSYIALMQQVINENKADNKPGPNPTAQYERINTENAVTGVQNMIGK